jgi:putative IMPACT (imprinted ancient) family translation regulator
VTIDYSLHGKVTHFLETNPEFTLKDTLFTENVTLIIMADEDKTLELEEKLINLLSNQCQISFGETDYVEIEI